MYKIGVKHMGDWVRLLRVKSQPSLTSQVALYEFTPSHSLYLNFFIYKRRITLGSIVVRNQRINTYKALTIVAGI